MSNDHQPLAVDPAYRLRDNQFWYGDCAFADVIRNRSTITLRITGLGVRVLTHAAEGRDGRPTRSFTLPSRQDRLWWEEHRGEQVRVELLSLNGDEPDHSPAPTTQQQTQPSRQPIIRPQENTQSNGQQTGFDIEQGVLCIGLDIAWFGGSAGNNDSQYDCLAAVLLSPEEQALDLQLHRVALVDRDPEAIQLLEAVDAILEANHAERGVFALDAPIQAEVRDHFDVRTPLPAAGMVERRAADNWLSVRRQEIDRQAGGANGWHPNIQPGAPLAPRVEHLLDGLTARGFDLWMPDNRVPDQLVIECFPAEAIWAMKRMGFYPDALTAAEAKAYKSQQRNHLSGEQVQALVHDVLHAFGLASVGNALWNGLVTDALAWMLADPTWRTAEGLYRGGKLLDDVVDTMICLATSLGYVRQQAHVWFDPEHPIDGHIIGPGFQQDDRWTAAWQSEVPEGAT